MRPWESENRPDEETLRQLVKKGYNDREIGEMFNQSPDNIAYKRKKAHPPIEKDTVPRLDHRADGTIPWDLDTAKNHHHDRIARLLRARNRRRHGLSNAPDVEKRIDRLERELREEDVVIDYNREIGFFKRRRDPSIDSPDAVVRQPTDPGV